ncbi:AAA family ATPase [Qipengyuania sp. DSG2-2]|uniref:AAA family ATPase n=1 Tax=Qipengyuania sp. DGS2-2 TaxID=3349631 RepID=UPI0036D27B64
MKYNPYQPNRIVAPGMFTGRLDEIAAVEKSLFQAKHGNPIHFIISGERGIGKSSLLMLVSRIASSEVNLLEDQKFNLLVVPVELGNVGSQIEIVRAIARQFKSELQRISANVEIAKSVWDFLSNWEVLGVRYHKSDVAPEPESARDSLADQMAEFCKHSGYDGIFIAIDEADAPSADAGLGEFLKYFTERLSRIGCNKVLFGLAGLPILLDRIRSSHPSAARIFNLLNLAPLGSDERMEVVKRGLAEANDKNNVETVITDDGLVLLAELSEGYPHFIQQFAYCAFESDVDDTIDAADVVDGAYQDGGAIAQLGTKYFDDLYFGKISSERYRNILNSMSEFGDQWLSRKQIINLSGESSTTVSNALNALKSRNILIADNTRQGFYKLPTRSFAAWINAIKSVEGRRQIDHTSRLPLEPS